MVAEAAEVDEDAGVLLESLEQLRQLRNSASDPDAEQNQTPERLGQVGEELKFDASLNPRQRALLHEACERLGLGHVSEGKGAGRAMSAWTVAPAARMKGLERALRVEATAAQERWEERLRDATAGEMEAGGLLLRDALLESTGVTSFGRSKWVLEQDASRPGPVHLIASGFQFKTFLARKFTTQHDSY